MNEARATPSDGEQLDVYRVAIYARFSSEMQNELSLEDQVVLCREEIARRGWRVAGIYTDSARSGWSLDRVMAMKQTSEQADVKLTKPIPVYFVYVSAWATPDGVVNFRPDIYNHDGAAETTASAY